MKAAPKVPVTVEKVEKRRVREVAGELRDRVGEASALVNAVNIIASTTTLDEASLGRLRHVILVALGAVTEAADVSAELTTLVRS